MEYTIEQSWIGGPLREFSYYAVNKQFKPWHDSGHPGRKFSRNYVCEVCHRSLTGIYEVKVLLATQRKWLCTECKRSELPKGEQPKQFKR